MFLSAGLSKTKKTEQKPFETHYVKNGKDSRKKMS